MSFCRGARGAPFFGGAVRGVAWNVFWGGGRERGR